MAIWKRPNKSGYVDLGEKMKKQQARIDNFRDNFGSEEEVKPVESGSSSSGFFGGFFGGGSTASDVQVDSSEEKRKKLADRLMNMTKRIEEMENEIYQLKQKLEVLERKQRVGY